MRNTIQEVVSRSLENTSIYIKALLKFDAVSWGVTAALAGIAILLGVIPCLVAIITLSIWMGIVGFIIMLMATFFIIELVDNIIYD